MCQYLIALGNSIQFAEINQHDQKLTEGQSETHTRAVHSSKNLRPTKDCHPEAPMPMCGAVVGRAATPQAPEPGHHQQHQGELQALSSLRGAGQKRTTEPVPCLGWISEASGSLCYNPWTVGSGAYPPERNPWQLALENQNRGK